RVPGGSEGRPSEESGRVMKNIAAASSGSLFEDQRSFVYHSSRAALKHDPDNVYDTATPSPFPLLAAVPSRLRDLPGFAYRPGARSAGLRASPGRGGIGRREGGARRLRSWLEMGGH